jgi:adenosylmethionine-8-amino-7-oxononanoate aminotransferase
MALRPTFVRADGLHVWDREGRRYLDAVSGSFCVQLGYTRPDLVQAMAGAAARLPFARPSRADSEQSAAYAEELLAESGPPFTRVYFTTSGSEAVEVALKAAYRYQLASGHAAPGSVAHLGGHYHGATWRALEVTGYGPRREPFEERLRPEPCGPPATCARCFRGLQYPTCSIACADAALAQAPAAIILESVPAAGLGAVVPPAGYFARMRERCDAAGALWIADEVLTGFGRCGDLFAWRRLAERPEDRGAVPDMVAFGKGAGAGFAPAGGVLVSNRVARVLEAGDGAGPFGHHQTYGGNPVACAVGRRVLEALAREKILTRVRAKEGSLERALRSLAAHPWVHDVRGLGFLWGIELTADREIGAPFPRELRIAERVERAALERGLLIHSGRGTVDGDRGDHLLVAPPLIAGSRDFARIAARLRGALDAAASRR